MIKRFKKSITERMQANAFCSVMSGREDKWYRNPFGRLGRLLLLVSFFGLVALEIAWHGFYQLVIPLLILCMFITIHRMNDKLDALAAAADKPTDTAIVIEWILEEIEKTD